MELPQKLRVIASGFALMAYLMLTPFGHLPVGTAYADTLDEQVLPDLQGASLRRELDRRYSPVRTLGYRLAREELYTNIDNADGMVEGIYSGYTASIPKNSPMPRLVASSVGINAEHVWPQSLGASGMAKSDMHILYPADEEVNQERSNYPFADIVDSQTDSWFLEDEEFFEIPQENIDAYSELYKPSTRSKRVFEPREQVKGDVARAMFYFHTVYPQQADSGFFNRQKRTLCAWQAQDPVSAKERERSNNIAATGQGNQNPYVADATLAERAYCG